MISFLCHWLLFSILVTMWNFAMVLCVVVVQSFSFLCSVAWCKHNTTVFWTPLLMSIWVGSGLWLLWIAHPSLYASFFWVQFGSDVAGCVHLHVQCRWVPMVLQGGCTTACAQWGVRTLSFHILLNTRESQSSSCCCPGKSTVVLTVVLISIWCITNKV